jgi:hypothetical protein
VADAVPAAVSAAHDVDVPLPVCGLHAAFDTRWEQAGGVFGTGSLRLRDGTVKPQAAPDG